VGGPPEFLLSTKPPATSAAASGRAQL